MLGWVGGRGSVRGCFLRAGGWAHVAATSPPPPPHPLAPALASACTPPHTPTHPPTLPLSHQVCTADGTCMDIVNAVPYIQKFKKHPVSGEPLELKDLIKCGGVGWLGGWARVWGRGGGRGWVGARGGAARAATPQACPPG